MTFKTAWTALKGRLHRRPAPPSPSSRTAATRPAPRHSIDVSRVPPRRHSVDAQRRPESRRGTHSPSVPLREFQLTRYHAENDDEDEGAGGQYFRAQGGVRLAVRAVDDGPAAQGEPDDQQPQHSHQHQHQQEQEQEQGWNMPPSPPPSRGRPLSTISEETVVGWVAMPRRLRPR